MLILVNEVYMEKNQTLIKLIEREINMLKRDISTTNETLNDVQARMVMLMIHRDAAAAKLGELQKFLETQK